MKINNNAGHLQDWITQPWVKLTGKRLVVLRVFLITILLSLSTVSPAIGQIINTTKDSSEVSKLDVTSTDSYEDNDFAPGLLFIALTGTALVFICIGIGVTLAATVLIIVFGLIAAGILSASFLVGLTKRSFAQGFKIFLLLSSCTGGIIISTVASFLINKVFNLHFATSTNLIAGVLCGLAGGALLAQIVYLIVLGLTSHLKKKYSIS